MAVLLRTDTGILFSVLVLTVAVLPVGHASAASEFQVIDSHSHESMLGSANLKTPTPSISKPEQSPKAMDLESGRVSPSRGSSSYVGHQKPVYQAECTVDFNDSVALSQTMANLWFDRIYVPWIQECQGAGYTDIRALVHSHFHVGFEDSDVEPCPNNDQAYPSRIQNDGSCEFVDITSEPRTHLSTHTGSEWLHIRVYRDSEYIPFDLNRIRVVGQAPIRFCYKPEQESNSGWFVSNNGGDSSPGTWLCWSELSTGLWDLSDWVRNVTDVKITGATAASFSLDDIKLGID